ncbi:MAG: hypothetical protein V3U57_08115 [Robiginitomaculum sp.]
MVKNNILHWVGCTAALGSVLGAGLASQAQATQLGQTVTNIASVGYDTPDGDNVTVVTNSASFVIEAARTESEIGFFRFSPNAPEAKMQQINGSDYSPSGKLTGPFSTVGPAGSVAGSVIDTSSPIPLIPASTYLTGELMFVRVKDIGQNGDKTQVETVNITLRTSGEDYATLRLYESGPNTGEFWAYMPLTHDASAHDDALLTAERNALLTATYIDNFNAQDVSTDTALIDPYGRVFNGLTGQLIDNTRVTLMNAATGQPATVFGVDGVSSYPSTLMTGQDVTDASGRVYELGDGEFRFPLAPQGEYYVVVDPPEGLSFASTLEEKDFVDLENGPFVILTSASYGKTFTLENSGPLNFDLPLDAETNFALNKSVSQTTGDVGDFISYTVSIENNGRAGAPVILRDTLPQGFKYLSGTTTLDGKAFADPQVSVNGRDLKFSLGALFVNQEIELKYTLKIGAGARVGKAVNSIVAIDAHNQNSSNISRASLQIREDLFRTHSTVVGRISQNSCDGEEDWAREILGGDGVAGVRLYMETGAYAISDKNGLYHFEGVKPGTHVVQLDEETLPKGFEPMVCEENSRYAGKAISQFVEVQGGGLWRANFYLKKTKNFVEKKDIKDFNDQTEYKDYDANWLGRQTADIDWVYPSPKRTPSIPSVNIGIKHKPNQKVTLFLNGKPVSSGNFEARDSDAKRQVMLSRWRGVDLLGGKNKFYAEISDMNGRLIKTISHDIHYVSKIARATALPDQSVLVADGRTKPVLAIRLEDEAGRPVHAGRITDIQVPLPYRLYNQSRLEGEDTLATPLSAKDNMVVGVDGIARVVLEPTLRAGKITVIITLDSGRKIIRYMRLTPEKRDWIIVGLAEGSTAYNNLTNKTIALANGASEGLETDGRVALFAKGLIKGNWLLTLAVDTDKKRSSRDGHFETNIDPNAYYTLYGDRSYNEFEAASRYPVYIKLEKKSFSAMFGDYETNITEGKLTRYNRHLSGFKSEYLGEKFQAIAYAAETNQGFTKDEIATDGTSGPFYLSNPYVLANSETITIETRDRTRPDIVLNSRRLVRHLDYTLDTYTGKIIFRLPVDATDSGFNPKVIVIDYETAADSERNLSYGGRVQTQIMGGKVQVGSTFVHEGGNGNNADGHANMVGAEIIAQVSKDTEVRAEYAVTIKKDANTARVTSNAYLLEVIHTSDKLQVDAYIRQEESGFGLKQRSTTTSDIRRYGANIAYKIQEFENRKTGRRGSRTVRASLSKQENLGTGSTRTLADIKVEQESDVLGLSAGFRQVKDNIVGSNNRESLLATASARYSVPKHGATFQISHEQPLGGKDSVSDYPQRTRLSIDKTLGSKATAHITHDILNGGNMGGQNTAIGISVKPWVGAEASAGSDMISSDSGRRLGATIGLNQQVQLTDKWSVSAGVANRRILQAQGSIKQITPKAAISPYDTNEGYMSGYVGVGYRTNNTSASARVETRHGASSHTYIVSVAGARKVSERLSFAGAVRANWSDVTPLSLARGGLGTGVSNRVDSRLALTWRPRNENLIVLNRLDMIIDNKLDGTQVKKVVNNLALNKQILDRWQLSGNYGVKYVQTNIGAQNFSGVTHLIGGETRFDITPRIDIGFHGSALKNRDTLSYSYGPSIGVSPVENVWLSLGYNVDGYSDDDFTAADYAQKGAYVKLRMKFDQNTARSLLNRISPNKK